MIDMKNYLIPIFLLLLCISYQSKPLTSPEQAQKHYDKAISHYSEGNYEKAIASFKKGVDFLPVDTLERARYYSNIGLFYSLLLSPPQYNQAIKYYEKSIAIREKHNDLPGDDCKETGRLYAEIGEYSKSLFFYKKAVSYLEKVENAPNELALTYVELGDKVYRNQNKFKEAIIALQKAEQLWRSNLEQHKAPVYIGLGNVYHDDEAYHQAIEYYQLGLNELKTFENKTQNDVTLDVARTLNNIGTTYTKLQKWELAHEFLFEALRLKLNLGKSYKTTISSSYNNIGEYYLDKNQLDSASLYYQHAIQLITDTTTSLEVSNNNFASKDNLPTATAMKSSNAKPSLVIYLADRAKSLNQFYKKPNDSKALQETFQTYLTLDTLVHILLDNVSEESQYVWIEKVRSIYENAIDVSHQLYELENDKNYLEAAFNFAESNKAVVLYRALQRNTLKEYSRPTQILKQIQQKLSSKDALIEYFVGENNTIYIFQITKNNIKLIKTNSSPTLNTQINQFNQFVENYDNNNSNHYQQYLDNAHSIYQILVEPVTHHQKRLIIIPDDNLYFLSFAALLTNKQNTSSDKYDLPYLIKKHQISYGFSTAMLLTNQNQTQLKKTFNLKIYAPNFQNFDNFSSLPKRAEEVKKIQEITNGDVAQDSISIQDFYKTYQDYQTLYLATHAKTINDSSFILFSDGFLTMNDIYERFNFNGQSIILGACETGIGELKMGEGIMSLTRALIYKGSSNVISSLWQIDDNSTSQIIPNYFQYLKNGKSSSSALHEAQINYLENSNRHHPKYWAAFTHTGVWEMENTSFFTKNRFLIGSLSIIFVLGLFIWQWWKK